MLFVFSASYALASKDLFKEIFGIPEAGFSYRAHVLHDARNRVKGRDNVIAYLQDKRTTRILRCTDQSG